MSVRYNLLNVKIRTYLDLQGGDSRNGTTVLVYYLNVRPVGTPTQQVRVIRVPPL
jgi:hypothetical protein